MPISLTLVDFNGGAGSGTSENVDTGYEHDFMLWAIHNYVSGGTANEPTIADAGTPSIIFDNIVSQAFDGGQRRITLIRIRDGTYSKDGDNPGSSGAVASFGGQSQTDIVWAVLVPDTGEWDLNTIEGLVIQSAGSSGTGTSGSFSLSVTEALAQTVQVFCPEMTWASNDIVSGAGFVELTEYIGQQATTIIHIAQKEGSNTNANASWTPNVNWGAVAIEFHFEELEIPIAVTPTTASLILTTFIPLILIPQIFIPTTTTLVLTSFAPVVDFPPLEIVPETASLILTTFIPSALGVNPILVTPTTASLSLTTYVPTIYWEPLPESLVPLPGPYPNAIIMEVREQGSATLLGVVTNIVATETEEAINEVGNFTVKVSATAVNVDLLTQNREITLVYEGEGDVFDGLIEHREWTEEGDGRFLIISGPSLMIELIRANTYRGININESSAQTAATNFLPSGWTLNPIAENDPDVTRRFDNMSYLECMLELASLSQAFIREEPVQFNGVTSGPFRRVIGFKDLTGTQSKAFRLINNEYATPEMLENEDLGLIDSIRIDEEGENIWNRIVPEAKTDAGDILSIGFSVRNSPYEIESLLAARPSIVTGTSFNFTVEPPEDPTYPFPIATDGESLETEGVNRLILVFVHATPNGVGTQIFATADGRKMILIDQAFGSGGGNGLFAFYLTEVPNKTVSIQVTAINGSDDEEIMIHVLALSVQDWDRVGEDFGDVEADQEDIAVGSTPDVTLQSKLGELLLDIGNISTTATATPDAGQTEFYDQVVTSPRSRVFSSYKYATGATENPHTMGYNLSSSSNYRYMVLRLKPALVYYIEDADSIAAYGLRTKILPLGSYDTRFLSARIFAANSMYDKGVDFLQEHKDPATFYECNIAHLPGTARSWFPGDTFALDYRDPDAEINIDQELVCVRRKAVYDENGVRHWNLTLSTVARHKEELEEAFVTAMQRLNTIQNSQV